MLQEGANGGVAGRRSEGDIGGKRGPLWAENKPIRSADELRSCSRCLRYILHRNRQTQNEDCATLRFILAGNLPMMLLHYSVHCAQSQAGAFADRLGGIKGIEHSIRLFYSWPTIGKLHYHFSTVDLSADPEQSSASVFQRVQRVLNDLDECLEQLVTVPPNFSQAQLPGRFGAEFFIVGLPVQPFPTSLA